MESNILIYQTEDGITKIETRLDNETVWLTQLQMAELFSKNRSVITKHLKNIFAEGELDKKSNVQNLHIANSDKPVTPLARASRSCQLRLFLYRYLPLKKK